MSMVRCEDCEAIFDSDMDCDCFTERGVLCSFCRPEEEDSHSVLAGKEIPESGKTLPERHSNISGFSDDAERTDGDLALALPSQDRA